MNEYIFYTCEGSTYPPREDKEVENCQLLGRAYGKNVREARKLLEEECPWIKECGFNIDEAISKQLLTDENRKDIKTIVEYLLEGEYKHYHELGEPQDHIYITLKRLQDLTY